ncbi:MAG: Sugar phosphate isomerase/epimerase [Verrucomicrobia bacterium]|nr:MAG: Sugar phosphate isomerase/epimerase [Verrucomicrobiota bacterium]
MNRRRLLQLAALPPLGFSLADAADSPHPRSGKEGLSPTLNAYSFLEPLNANLADPTTGIDLFGVCDFCAQHEIEAVDLTGYFFPGYPKAPADDYIARIKRYTRDRGIAISGTGVKNDFATADKKVRAEGVALTKRWIEVAAQLGAPVVRVFAGPQQKNPRDWQSAAGGAPREEVETWMAEALLECAAHGETYGVALALQNHGDFLSNGPDHLSLLKRVNHAWCGALVDTGKYFTDDPYADIALMVPHAVNWQIKETLGSKLKTPPTDFRKLVKIIHDGGYRGFLPIETLAMGRKDYDPAAEILKALKAMREAIAEMDLP